MARSVRMKRLGLLLFCGSAWVAPHASADEAGALAVLRAGCTQDAQRFCANVQPGGGRILACLKEHKNMLSDQCKQAAQQAAGMSGTAQGPASAPSNGSTSGAPSNGSTSGAPSNGPTPGAPSNGPSSGAPSSGSTSGAVPAMPGTAAPPAGTQSEPAAQSTSSATAKRSAAPADSPGTYLRLKKVQISYAFVASLPEPQVGVEMLVPTTWDYRGAIQMYGGKGGCPNDSFSVAWEAKSPDGLTKALGIPDYSWQYSDDPQELQKLNDPNRRWHSGTGGVTDVCPVSKPLNAEQYLRQNMLNDLKPQMTVVSVEPLPALEQIVRQQNGLPADGGNNGAHVDAIRARMEFQKDGQAMELWYSVAILTRTYRVGRGSLYDMHALGQIAFGAPKGKLDANDRLFKVMLSSVQSTAPYRAFAAKHIASEYQLQAQKEAAIDKVRADVINTMTQTYLNMSANAQRVSDQGFRANDQNIRDVQSFRDPTTGRTFELSNQYGHAWLNGANEYVMSDDPNFNPNAQLPGNWNQLQPVPP